MHKYDLLIRAFQIYYCGKITFQFIFRILMNLAGTNISEGCLLELYLNNKCDSRQPVVQVIDFQQSQANEKEITIRVSDRLYFIDCTLSGNYLIQNDCIIETKNLTILTTIKRLQFVKLIDYFNKIEQGKICKLQIIIRKMQQICSCNEVMGSPQQIQQYIINNKKTAILSNHKELYHEAYSSVKKMHVKQSKDQDYHNNHKSEHTIIKIEPDVQYQQPIYYSNQSNNHSYHSQTNGTKTQKKQYITNTNDHPGFNESLTLQDIMHGKEGYLIGRLVRFKSTRKQTKDGPMTVCYLGLVDKYNELIRIHLAGRLAMSNQKILKKKKCYYIKGFDLVNVKNTGTQIRLKDKQYKIVQVYNDQLTRYLCNDYYHWDHVSDCQNEYVDVIGVVDDIQKKATYSPNNQLDPKSVIRVVIKNKFKSIRISFWTDQIKVLESFNLKKKEVIIIEDIKKKQSKYYDFGFESNLIQLNQGDNQLLLERFKDILPENIQQREPQNIRQLNELFEDDPNDSKLRTIVAYLTHCQENKIIYRLCDQCKKKVQKMATQCHQCGSEVLIFKYNCPLEFSDATGSMIVILFDVVANKLIGRTAMEISQMSEQQIEKTFENLFYKPYILSIQNRNKRIILRSIDEMNQVQQIATLRDNITKINNMITKQIW